MSAPEAPNRHLSLRAKAVASLAALSLGVTMAGQGSFHFGPVDREPKTEQPPLPDTQLPGLQPGDKVVDTFHQSPVPTPTSEAPLQPGDKVVDTFHQPGR